MRSATAGGIQATGEQLHVCFISQEYPPETGWGGIGSYTYEMAHGLSRLGHRVTVISRALERESVSDSGGVTVYRVMPAPDWNRYPGTWRLNGYWPGFAWAAMRKARRIHAQARIDVLESAECGGDNLFAVWPFGRPVVVTRLHTPKIVVDKMNGATPNRKHRLLYLIERRVIQSADVVTAPSRAMVERLAPWTSVAGERLEIVPNPIDTYFFTPSPEPQGGCRVLFAGRLEKNKGAEVLASVVPAVLGRAENATFLFAGADGLDSNGRSWRERILAAVPEADRQRVRFVHVERADLPDLYRNAAVCVVPSFWENCPYVVLEAMACGVPVVASKVGGIPEIVEDGNEGYLVAPGDVDGMVDRICELASDPATRGEMIQRARLAVQRRFDSCVVVPAMLNVYRRAMELRRAA